MPLPFPLPLLLLLLLSPREAVTTQYSRQTPYLQPITTPSQRQLSAAGEIRYLYPDSHLTPNHPPTTPPHVSRKKESKASRRLPSPKRTIPSHRTTPPEPPQKYASKKQAICACSRGRRHALGSQQGTWALSLSLSLLLFILEEGCRVVRVALLVRAGTGDGEESNVGEVGGGGHGGMGGYRCSFFFF